MRYGDRVAEKSMAKSIAAGIPLLVHKTSDRSEKFRSKVTKYYLLYHLQNIRSVESAKRILRNTLAYIDGKGSVSEEVIDSRVFQIAELIGVDFDSNLMSSNDAIHNVLIGLEQVRDRLSDVVKSRSTQNILDLLKILEEDKLNKRSYLDKSINDLITSLVSAFEPERILNSVDEDEASREWLKQNSLYEELNNKYENIQKYRESGKFLRDFWLMNKQYSKGRV